MAAMQAAPLRGEMGYHSLMAPLSKGPSRRVSSLDTEDLLRFGSSSSFGFFEFGQEDEAQSSFVQINNWGDINAKSQLPSNCAADSSESNSSSDDQNDDACDSGGDKVQFELSQAMTLTTRTFQTPKGKSVPYAVAIRAFRVLGGGGGHAQYQIVVSTQERIWKCWKRFSDFKLLAEYAKVRSTSPVSRSSMRRFTTATLPRTMLTSL
jgi:hypothetical protein